MKIKGDSTDVLVVLSHFCIQADIRVKLFPQNKDAVLGSLEHAAFLEYHLGVTPRPNERLNSVFDEVSMYLQK